MPIFYATMDRTLDAMLRLYPIVMLGLCAVLSLPAQVMVNNGTTITLTPHAVLHINGTYVSRANGILTAADSARITVTGSLHVLSGRVVLDGRSSAIVDSNLTTSGIPCVVAYGTLERRGTGSLVVKGSLVSEGSIVCTGTVHVWRDFLNRGSLTNSGLIEVGQP